MALDRNEIQGYGQVVKKQKVKRPKTQTLTLVRVGELTVQTVRDRTNQCGTNGAMQFAYKAKITVRADALDDQGFIIDQLEVHDLLQDRFRNVGIFPSCEEMALRSAELLFDRVVDALKVVVSVGVAPQPKSFVSAELTI